MTRVAAVVLFAIGIALLVFGVRASDSFVDRISEAFTGRFTDATMLYLALGIVGIVAGFALLVPRRNA